MKKQSFYNIFIVLLLVVLTTNCKKDLEVITKLPENILIQITSKNLTTKTANLVATQTTGNQEGVWSIESENITVGSFSTTSNSVTAFTGSILEPYLLKWTIDNGENIISNSITLLICEGEAIKDVIQAERDVKKLLNYYSITLLVNNGITFPELVEAGVSYTDLLDLYYLSEIYNAGGITITEVINSGISLHDIYYVYSWWKTRILLDEGYTVTDLLNESISLQEIYNRGSTYGATLQEIVDANIPLKDIILGTADDSNYDVSTLEILDLNLSQQRLIDEGIIVETPTSGFYIINYFHHNLGDHSYSNSIIDKLNLLLPNSGAQWHMPSHTELQFIYDNKDILDLMLDNENLYDPSSYSWLLFYCSTLRYCADHDYDMSSAINFSNGSWSSCDYGGWLIPVIQL